MAIENIKKEMLRKMRKLSISFASFSYGRQKDIKDI